MSESSLIIPKIASSEVVHKGFFTLRIDKIKLPHGIQRPYTVLETGHHAAAIIAINEDNQIVTLKEYRHPTGKWVFGCPGGRIDAGESPIEAAKRELLEETGHTASEFIYLGNAYPFAAVSEQTIHYILAKGAKSIQEPTHEPYELMQIHVLSEQQLYKNISNGDPLDGVLCTALFFKDLLTKTK